MTLDAINLAIEALEFHAPKCCMSCDKVPEYCTNNQSPHHAHCRDHAYALEPLIDHKKFPALKALAALKAQSLTADAVKCENPNCKNGSEYVRGDGWDICPMCKGAGSNGIHAGVLGNCIKNPCPACTGSGKAPTVSPGNSKDGWLSEKDILWWIEMFESGKALREKEPFAFERVAIPVLKMALTASSQEKRK